MKRAAPTALVIALAGCGGEQHAPPIRRACHVTPLVGHYLGAPIRVYGFRPTSALLVQPPRRFKSKSWGGDKTLFRTTKARGRLVVRGRRVDGGSEIVRFGNGDVPPDHLVVTPGLDATTYTRVEAYGCYSYLIRGRGFSERITFRAVPLERTVIR